MDPRLGAEITWRKSRAYEASFFNGSKARTVDVVRNKPMKIRDFLVVSHDSVVLGYQFLFLRPCGRMIL